MNASLYSYVATVYSYSPAKLVNNLKRLYIASYIAKSYFLFVYVIAG